MADDPKPIDIDELLDLNEHGQPVPGRLVEGQPPEERREPEVRAAEPARETRPAPQPSSDDRLTQALQTIENLQRQVSQLSEVRGADRAVDRPEPSIEYEEVLPGRRIPKDPTKRPVRLRTEDLIRLGWNDDKLGPAHVLETLGNAFFGFIMDSVPAFTMNLTQAQMAAANQAAAIEHSFLSEFEDLQPHKDFVKVIETGALQSGYLSIRGKTQQQYNQELGKLVREKVASMRGISYDQYVASLGGGRSTSRAVTTPTGGTRSRRPAEGEQEKYLNDTY